MHKQVTSSAQALEHDNAAYQSKGQDLLDTSPTAVLPLAAEICKQSTTLHPYSLYASMPLVVCGIICLA